MKAITLYSSLKEQTLKKEKNFIQANILFDICHQKKRVKMNTETTQINKETQGLGFEEFIVNMA